MEVLVKRKDCEVVFLEENNGMCVVEGIYFMLFNFWKGMKLILVVFVFLYLKGQEGQMGYGLL